MATGSEKSVLRKVFFFRLGNSIALPDLQRAIEHIANLPFNDQGRYLPTSSDDIVLALWVEQPQFPIRLQFGRIKRSDLPLVEDQGSVSPLQIAQSAGVLDWSHIVVFEDGIVAAEFNRDAPRITRLGEYLYFKARGILDTTAKFLPLFERAVMDELARFSEVTILEVEAPTSEADSVAEADGNLGAALRACRNAGQVKTARLMLKAPEKGRLQDLRALAARLFLNPRSREVLTQLKVTGKTDKGRRPLDLLEDYLVASEAFVRLDNRTRALAPAHAFAVIESAYNDNKHRFANAATAADSW
jgi:hypothetical protein